MPEPTMSRSEPSVPLREFVDAKIAGLEKYVQTHVDGHIALNEARFASIEKAVDVALAALEARLASLNEFRETLRDQNSTFLRTDAFDARMAGIEKDLLDFGKWRAGLDGKASQKSVTNVGVLSFIGLSVSVVSFLIKILER